MDLGKNKVVPSCPESRMKVVAHFARHPSSLVVSLQYDVGQLLAHQKLILLFFFFFNRWLNHQFPFSPERSLEFFLGDCGPNCNIFN